MKNRVVGLDCKWPVTMNRHGYLTSSGKVSLIQICYIDNEDKLHVLLIWVGHLKSLPNRLELETFLCDHSIKFVGVAVSADLVKIGKDFKTATITSVTQKDRPSVINLGTYA